MNSIHEEFAWACLAIHGHPPPFIHTNSVRSTRADAQAYIGTAWARDGESDRQGWKRAYRRGWRCVRVKIEPAFMEAQDGK